MLRSSAFHEKITILSAERSAEAKIWQWNRFMARILFLYCGGGDAWTPTLPQPTIPMFTVPSRFVSFRVLTRECPRHRARIFRLGSGERRGRARRFPLRPGRLP